MHNIRWISRNASAESQSHRFETQFALVVGEFANCALLNGVVASAANAKAAGRHLSTVGCLSSYAPPRLRHFQEFVPQAGDRGTSDFVLALQAFREKSELASKIWISAIAGRADSALTAAEWRSLARMWAWTSVRAILVIRSIPRDGQFTDIATLRRLDYIAGMLAEAREGGTPCVSADGLLFVPGLVDRRGAERIPKALAVRLSAADHSCDAVISDISVSGVGISGAPELAIGTPLCLALPDGRTLEAQVVWSRAGALGAKLSHLLSEHDALFRADR